MSNVSKIHIDLRYLASADRIHLSLRSGVHRSDWWLTRRLTSLIVSHWLYKMGQVDLPELNLPGVSKIKRNLAQEHVLSLEFDGPLLKPVISTSIEQPLLATEATLSVSESECIVVFKSSTNDTSKVKLTRKEAHAFLEMLAGKARAAGWLTLAQWPEWIGVQTP
jgi:hypothetical protein